MGRRGVLRALHNPVLRTAGLGCSPVLKAPLSTAAPSLRRLNLLLGTAGAAQRGGAGSTHPSSSLLGNPGRLAAHLCLSFLQFWGIPAPPPWAQGRTGWQAALLSSAQERWQSCQEQEEREAPAPAEMALLRCFQEQDIAQTPSPAEARWPSCSPKPPQPPPKGKHLPRARLSHPTNRSPDSMESKERAR